jgi:hypothetical protein
MAGLPAPADPRPARGVSPSEGSDPDRRPRLQLEPAGSPPVLELGTGSVLRTIVTAARRHAAESGSASEIRDLTNALERAVALLVPELRQTLLQSLQSNFGLNGAGEGTAGHVWQPTKYGALCEGCGFSVASSEPRMMQALANTPCTGKYDDTAALLREKARPTSAARPSPVEPSR